MRWSLVVSPRIRLATANVGWPLELLDVRLLILVEWLVEGFPHHGSMMLQSEVPVAATGSSSKPFLPLLEISHASSGRQEFCMACLKRTPLNHPRALGKCDFSTMHPVHTWLT